MFSQQKSPLELRKQQEDEARRALQTREQHVLVSSSNNEHTPSRKKDKSKRKKHENPSCVITMPKKRRARDGKLIARLEIEFVLHPLSFLSQAWSLWRKSLAPVAVYFKVTYNDHSEEMIDLSMQKAYPKTQNEHEILDTILIFSDDRQHYYKFKRQIEKYKETVVYRENYGISTSVLWSRWCRSRFSDNDTSQQIHYHHHFILHLLNKFHQIVNNNSKITLLNVSQNISLEEFYLNCKTTWQEDFV